MAIVIEATAVTEEANTEKEGKINVITVILLQALHLHPLHHPAVLDLHPPLSLIAGGKVNDEAFDSNKYANSR